MMWRLAILLLFGCAESLPRAPVVSEAREPSPVPAPILSAVRELANPPFGTGAAIAVWTPGGTSSIVCGVTRPGGAEVLPETLFNLASVTKTLTAAAALHAIEGGGLTLDSTVAS